MGKYVELPTSRKALGLETRKMLDDYIGKRITYEEAKKQVEFWSVNLGEFIFSVDDNQKFNPTFSQFVGVKRLRIFEKMLPEMQLKINKFTKEGK